MGQPWSGTPQQQIGFANNYQPGGSQESVFNQYAGQGAPNLSQNSTFGAGSDLLQNILKSQYNPQQYEQLFQQGVVNPAMQNYEQQVLPAISSRYYTPGAVHGSALNQAINQSAKDLQGGLNSLRSGFLMQGQEQHYNRQQNALNNALGWSQAPFNQQSQFFQNVTGARPHSPMIQEAQGGWLKDVLNMITQLLGQGAKGYAQGLGMK